MSKDVDGALAPEHASGRHRALLALTALGVVFGDIGTSPLYAFRESFHHGYGIAPSPANVLGVLSLIVWALTLVISVKYVAFVLRADNRGEGGMIALTALVAPPSDAPRRGRSWLVLLGLFGAALLYGDGMITPAITVLSAVEGLDIATPLFRPYILPIAIGVLVALFAVQSRGTAGIGRVFGPVMLAWFLTLAGLGVLQIVRAPDVFQAVNPLWGANFLLHHGWAGFLVLGSVFLAVTGAEALYADLGHFGTWPIRVSWFVVVFPALLLNYFGQGALLIHDAGAVENPFYHMVPQWALYPVIAIATVAAVIASQAVISGTFSLTRQAVQLGFLPRLEIEHTSVWQIGQIYVPAVNWTLMAAAIGLVVGFGSSSSLAAAYGVAVTTDMVFTTILLGVVARSLWRWSVPVVAAMVLAFLSVDLAFWGANLVKVPDGGWFPLVVAGAAFTVMTTWKTGRRILGQRMQTGALPVDLFLQDITRNPPVRVPGTAVFMYSNPNGTPPALLHNLKHNKVLHERVVFLTVTTPDVPHVAAEERADVEPLGAGIYRMSAKYGFAEDPDVPELLARCRLDGAPFKLMETTFFLGSETLIASRQHRGMAIWREKLFALMSRNARRATAFFRLPPNRVVELGTQIEL